MHKAIQNSSLAVIGAPVANADRRALSEAWYAALHVQTTPEGGPAKGRHAGKPSGRQFGARLRTENALEGRGRITSASCKRTVQARIRQVPGWERTAPRATLARKIERLVLGPQRPNYSATLTLDGDRGRVHIVIRVLASGVRIIAVCAPKAREVVREALLQARYALARNGVALDATLQSLAS